MKQAVTQSQIKNRKHSIRFKQYADNKDLIIMLLPGLLLLILFCYVPLYGLLIAFKDFRMAQGVLASPWVGFEHFKSLFSGQDFYRIFRNTVVISMLKLICGFPAPIILALLLNEMRNEKYKRIIQTFSYLPHFFSWIILGGIIMMLFSTRGPVNTLLSYFGVTHAFEFFADKGLFLFLLVLTSVWQSAGWGSIIYLAALSGVDDSLYEAAYMDGAGRWKQVLYISIPMITSSIITMFILNLGHVLNAGFDQIYNLYNPTVYEVSDILDTYVMRRLQTMDYSIGTAVGLFKSVIALVLVILTNTIVRRISDGEQGIW